MVRQSPLGCFPGRRVRSSFPPLPRSIGSVYNRFFAMTTMPKTQLPGAQFILKNTTTGC